VTLGGANICDPSPWQLIFSDDFNGDTLDLTKWHTYGVYFDQFPPGDNWGNARCGQGSGAVYLDDNVVVSDGTCKLITKEGFYEWNCDTCAIHGPFYT